MTGLASQRRGRLGALMRERCAGKYSQVRQEMNVRKLLLVCALVVIVGAWFAVGLDRYLQFDALKGLRDQAQAGFAEAPVRTVALFFVAYVVMAALSIPGAAVMTVLSGAIFGLGAGTLVVSLASTLGATLAMLIGRYLLRPLVRERFARQAARMDRGIHDEGALYLLALRLVPVFPFFAVNLAMALTAMRAWTYAWLSMLGMFPGTVVFVNAGTELGQLDSLEGIVAPEFIIAFSLLGIVPLVVKRLVDGWRRRRLFAGFSKPKQFDQNLVVIGAGAAGLVSAYIAAAVKAKVMLVERHQMGGDCLNTGCVPSKALIRAAKAAHEIRTAGALGVHASEPQVEFAEVMATIRDRIAQIEPHDSVARYESLGVTCAAGHAEIVSPWCVCVDGREVTTRAIIIAAGARPAMPPVPGLADAAPLTSDTLWDLEALPEHLTVMGGGPIGCELAQAFARLGSRVTLVEMAERVLARESTRASQIVAESLRNDGVNLLLNARVAEVSGDSSGGQTTVVMDAGEQHIQHDRLLVAVGRVPNTEGFGLERLGITTAKGGVVETDEYLQTLFPNIYACGDVAGPFQFTHTAAHQAWYAAVNALFGSLKRFRADYRVIPRVTYTAPEVASVGISHAQALAAKLDVEVTTYELDDLDRAIVDNEARGFVEVITPTGKDQILGATVVGAHGGELLATLALAMRHRLGLKKILGTVHAYPTFMEANKFVAGQWSRAHLPARLLRWVAAYHTWLRGRPGKLP